MSKKRNPKLEQSHKHPDVAYAHQVLLLQGIPLDPVAHFDRFHNHNKSRADQFVLLVPSFQSPSAFHHRIEDMLRTVESMCGRLTWG